MISVFCLFSICLQAQKKIPVYHNNKHISYLYTDTTVDYDDCYTLDTLTVWGKNIIVQTEVEYRGYADSTKIFYPRFFVELNTENNKQAIIKFNSVTNGDTYWLYLRKEKSSALCIYEERLWYPNASVSIKIAEDDFDDFRCSHICRKTVHKLIGEKIIFTDFFDFDTGMNIVQCFDCPQQYSLSKCLQMYKHKKKFDWK
jgi:hypothetical protein